MSLAFDPIAHRYTYDGVEVPSVTSILTGVGISDYSRIPRDVLARAAARGTAVHEAIEYLLADDLDWSSVADEIEPYVSAYVEWVRDTGWQPVQIECRLYHPTLRYAGTADQIGTLGGEMYVLDLKTSARPAEWWAIQTMAYRECLPDREVRRGALRLGRDGRAQFIPHDRDARDRGVWHAAVTVHHWRGAHNGA